jgi:hypothetical protein
MITVPTCRECNSGRGDGVDRDMALDEEYTRTILCMMEGATRHPVANQLLHEKVFKSFALRPGLRQSLAKTMELVTGRTETGILVPNVPTFQVDWTRVNRVLRKIGKGLFYQFMHRPLPTDAVVEVWPFLDQPTFEIFAKIIMDASHVGPFVLGDRTVIFAGGRNTPDAVETAWLVNFYQMFGACVYTMSAEHAARLDEERRNAKAHLQ